MSEKHTAGPWRQDKWGAIRDKDGQMIRTCGVALANSATDEVRANDRLIAAAPDLLEACESMISAAMFGDEDEMDAAVRIAHAAVAIATNPEQSA